MAEQELCPHLDSIGEVTKEDLLQKSKVGFHSFTWNVKEAQFRSLDVCAMVYTSLKVVVAALYHFSNNHMSWNICSAMLSLLGIDSEKHPC